MIRVLRAGGWPAVLLAVRLCAVSAALAGPEADSTSRLGLPLGGILDVGQELRPILDRERAVLESAEVEIPPGMVLCGAVGLDQDVVAKDVVRFAGPKGEEGGGRITTVLRNVGAKAPEERIPLDPVVFAVELQGPGGSWVRLWSRRLTGRVEEERRWEPFRVSLADFAGIWARFRFIKEGVPPLARGVWALPVLRPAAPRVKKLIVLLSLDTLRADHLGAYGYPRATSPTLDRLARQSLLFSRAFSNSPWTLPAHLSMMTGLGPPEHGVRQAADRGLPAEIPTLAEAFLAAGYTTAAFTGGGYLGPTWHVNRGFQVFNYAGGGARRVFQRALGWLDERPGEKLFLFLHTYETHAPYAAHAPQRVFARRLPPGRSLTPAMDVPLQRLRDAYDEGVRNLDVEVSRLFRGLSRRGLWGVARILALSDHGEEFQDHGGVGHEKTLYREVLAIPLLIRGQGSEGRIEPRLSSLLEVPGTVLDLAGDVPARGLPGNDLFGPPGPPRLHGKETFISGFKAALHLPEQTLLLDGAGPARLFDPHEDPGERRDVALDRAGRWVEAARSFALCLMATIDEAQIWFATGPAGTAELRLRLPEGTDEVAARPLLGELLASRNEGGGAFSWQVRAQQGSPVVGLAVPLTSFVMESLAVDGTPCSRGAVGLIGGAPFVAGAEITPLTRSEKQRRLPERWPPGLKAVVVPPVSTVAGREDELPDEIVEQLQNLGYL
jgi:hypothetical protein